MNMLKDKLLKLKETLKKGMQNAGLGGPGSVKAGAVLPSLPSLSKPGGNNSATPSVQMPQKSKKNPIKVAEQTQNKDIKDIKMKEAQVAIANKPKEVVKFDDNGQWSLEKAKLKSKYHVSHPEVKKPKKTTLKKSEDIEKSGYKGYTEADNARRKANNLSEGTGIKTMDRIKQYGGSGPNAAAKEAAEMRRKSKKNPVKEYTKEEIEALNRERNLKKD